MPGVTFVYKSQRLGMLYNCNVFCLISSVTVCPGKVNWFSMLVILVPAIELK